jgi:hypothetical protein
MGHARMFRQIAEMPGYRVTVESLLRRRTSSLEHSVRHRSMLKQNFYLEK